MVEKDQTVGPDKAIKTDGTESLARKRKKMTRTHALLKLLELGPLTRKEIRHYSGWTEKTIKFVMAGAARNRTIVSLCGKWHRRYENGLLQKDTL